MTQSKRNAIAAGVNVALSGAANFFFQPYLVDRFPPGALSLLAVANTATSYLGLAMLAATAALARNVMRASLQGDEESAQEFLGTGLALTLGFTIAILLVGCAVVWQLDRVISIPPELGSTAPILFAFVFLAFGISQLRTVYQVALFRRDRLDYQHGLSLSETLTRIVVAIVLIEFAGRQLAFVGLGMVIAAIATTVASGVLWRRLMDSPRLTVRDYRPHRRRELMALGGWTIVDQLGILLLYQSDVILANRLATPLDADRYAAVASVALLVRLAIGSVASTLNPAFVRLATLGSPSETADLTVRRVHQLGILTAIPVGILVGMGEPLLGTWLGAEFGTAYPVLVALVAPMALNLPMMALFAVWNSRNLLRAPAWVSLAFGGLMVAGGWYAWDQLRMGILGLALAVSLATTARNLVFAPWYVSRILAMRPVRFLPPILVAIASSAAIAAVGYAMVRLLPPSNVAIWIAEAAVVGAIAGGLAFKVGGLRSIAPYAEATPPESGEAGNSQ